MLSAGNTAAQTCIPQKRLIGSMGFRYARRNSVIFSNVCGIEHLPNLKPFRNSSVIKQVYNLAHAVKVDNAATAPHEQAWKTMGASVRLQLADGALRGRVIHFHSSCCRDVLGCLALVDCPSNSWAPFLQASTSAAKFLMSLLPCLQL